jgi:hypothetical protein
MQSCANAARRASGREGGRCQPAEETPRQAAAVVEDDARRDGWAIQKHFSLIAHEVSVRDMRFAPIVIASQRVGAKRRSMTGSAKQSSLCSS